MKKDMYGNTLQVKRFKPLKEPVKMPEPRVPIPFNEAGMMASVLAIEANIIAGRQPITLTIPRTPNAAR